MEQPGGANAAAVGSRYDALLQQIVQLNTDLQKTAALSQTLQRERDGLQQNNSKVDLSKALLAAERAALIASD